MGSSLGPEQASGPCLWVRREFARIPRIQNSIPFLNFIFVRLWSLFFTLFPFISVRFHYLSGSCVVSLMFFLLGIWRRYFLFFASSFYSLQYLINSLKVTHPALHCLAFVSCIATTILHCFSFISCFIT